MRTIIIIPARWASTRLPGKPLAMIGNKPMIQHTWEKAIESKANEVVIATDNEFIYDTCKAFGADVVMTGDYDNGTERVIAVQKNKNADFVINLQGDEPFISTSDIDQVIDMTRNYKTVIATLKTQLTTSEATDPNTVKVVTDQFNSALMFTRSCVYKPSNVIYKHIGIYGYSNVVLDMISNMEPSVNSIHNTLEQLTWLDNNIHIVAGYTESISFGIDTPLDLQLANKIYK
jgi:3-deoxy-manno-octulosonate cytidylyltransferase (CMP-KDO synthetase)